MNVGLFKFLVFVVLVILYIAITRYTRLYKYKLTVALVLVFVFVAIYNIFDLGFEKYSAPVGEEEEHELLNVNTSDYMITTNKNGSYVYYIDSNNNLRRIDAFGKDIENDYGISRIVIQKYKWCWFSRNKVKLYINDLY
jgi:uncharacterized membrane protein YfhO